MPVDVYSAIGARKNKLIVRHIVADCFASQTFHGFVIDMGSVSQSVSEASSLKSADLR